MAFFSCLKCFSKPPAEESVSSLDLAHCSLDSVPSDIFLHERTLEHLVLDCNNLRDLPRQLFQCCELRTLSMADNDVHSLPDALSSLTQLQKLTVAKNVLTDIPDTIKQLKQLRYLDASVNPLQKIPEGCTQLLNITELFLNDTFLEFLPANFGRLVKLRILELRENALNALPKSLSRLTQLQRLDLGQNEISELPEVIGSLTELTELWVDANRIKQIPAMIGNLTKLTHLEASFNHIDHVSDKIAGCTSVTHLALSTNDLKSLPETLGEMTALVTLKLDDNQIEKLPSSIGKLRNLEELVLSQNYLESLPPSLGLCRRLHTLNVDDNDIDAIPKEVGSCIALRILSAHGNRLTTLPAELDHIADLAVINLTANMIQNLPVSFMKLTKITALWLSENQNKPLIQLNQDTDPETGQRVLTNFMLPQQPETNPYLPEPEGGSDTGSFHPSVWEEERQRKSHVKWAGQGEHVSVAPLEDDDDEEKTGGQLRREPTPFPKEMRAMAKRVQNMRNKNGTSGSGSVKRKEGNEGKGRKNHFDSPHNSSQIQIKEARVSKPHASPVLSERHLLAVYKDEKTIKEQMELKQFEDLERSFHVNGGATTQQYQQQQQHANVNNGHHLRRSPDKTSRDSGVITPSDDSITSEPPPLPPSVATRKPSDPLPMAPRGPPPNNVPSPYESKPPVPVPAIVKAQLVTSELDSSRASPSKPVPPPYHIAAAMSKHANDFGALQKPGMSNGNRPEGEMRLQQQQQLPPMDRNGSFRSDDTASSVSGSEVSTAASSLQTIVRGPFKHDPHHNGGGGLPHSVIPQASPLRRISAQQQSESVSSSGDVLDAHALQLRKVSEQLLSNPRTRQSVTGIPIFNSSRPGSFASPKDGSGSSPLGSKIPYSRPSSQLSRVSQVHAPSPVPYGVGMSNGHGLVTPSPQQAHIRQTNGLLNTIEKAAHSDDESSAAADSGSFVQPNYENVSAPINDSVSDRVAAMLGESKIPVHVSSPSNMVMSTAQYSRPISEGSYAATVSSLTRPLPTPPSTKIPVFAATRQVQIGQPK